jgi:hypothetical protein
METVQRNTELLVPLPIVSIRTSIQIKGEQAFTDRKQFS